MRQHEILEVRPMIGMLGRQERSIALLLRWFMDGLSIRQVHQLPPRTGGDLFPSLRPQCTIKHQLPNSVHCGNWRLLQCAVSRALSTRRTKRGRSRSRLSCLDAHQGGSEIDAWVKAVTTAR